MSTQREKAEELRRLHAAPEPLVLVNAWDAASARVVAAAPGARAIATASWSIAAARGLPGRRGDLARGDDRRRSRIVARGGRAAGDGGPRARVRRRAADASRARWRRARSGCNLEDSDGAGGLWPAEEHAAVVAAARAAGDAAGIPLVINARTDVYLDRRDPGRGARGRGARARRGVPGGGRGLHLRPGRARPGDARGARQGDGRPDQRARRRGRPDAGRAGAASASPA